MKKYFLFLLLLPLLTACGNDDVLDDTIDAAIEALEHNFDYEGAISELEGNHVYHQRTLLFCPYHRF